MAQKEVKKFLKEYLEINMHIRGDNIKMDIKENTLFLDLILHYNSGKSKIFGKVRGYFE
jgi:hypothetical protein